MAYSSLFLSDLECSERVAVWSIRTLMRLEVPSCHSGGRRILSLFPECCWRGLEAAEAALQEGLRFMHASTMVIPEIGFAGAQEVFLTEQRFLQAIERAQNGNQHAVRAILEPDFSHFYLQSRFSLALMLLADCLAGVGHWLPFRQVISPLVGLRPFSAPCLTSVMRWNGDRSKVIPGTVLWPEVSAGQSQVSLRPY